MTSATRPEFDAATKIVAKLDRPQKIAMLSGADFWHTKALPEHGVAGVMVTDGPHGLRKQATASDHVGLSESVPATCFPTACALGSTWDVATLEAVGAALGRETRAEDVAVLLGPGLNLKRHPAGGRNFEYFSEDPLLAGKSAAALVRGIQSEGVGTSIKHFAANNQESHRMSLDTIVDTRTLRELYLTGFETAVVEGQPWTVMCAYNLVNGTHAGESRRLLTDILRDEWGFDGLVVSDWLAVFDRPAGVHAGLDLEMPSSSGAWDPAVASAIESGELGEADLDLACARVIELALRAASGQKEHAGTGTFDVDAHHALARKAAAEGTVLLTNDGLLPLAASAKVALIGAFAETPRYQGAGSSQVNPTRLDTALEALKARGGECGYAPGYDPKTGEATATQLTEAATLAAGADVAVVLVGLPSSYESEGFDRTHLRMPASMYTLVEQVVAANPRTAVVLINGAPVELGFATEPAAVVEAYLGGQAAGGAIVDVLFGDAEPGGRLAESFPMAASDLPSNSNFANHPTQVVYYEGLNIGYRFHDTWDVAPRFCFGHGLSYTTFSFSAPKVAVDGTDVTVTTTVKNTGKRAGSTVVQLYVHDVASSVFRPEQELKGFAKVHLDAGASGQVTISLDRRAFAVWDTAASAWLVEAGEFELRLGTSSRAISHRTVIAIESADVVASVPAPVGPVATRAEFEAVLGRPVPEPRGSLPFTIDSGIGDLTQTALGRLIHGQVMKQVAGNFSLDDLDESTATMMKAVIGDMPLRGLVTNSGGKLSFALLHRLLAVLNFFGGRKPARTGA